MGNLAKDFEAGVDFQRLIRERFGKAQAAVKARGLGAVLCFDMDNIRYVTGTLIGNVFLDFLDHFALCPREGKPFLFDPAVVAKRVSCPWMEDHMEAPISILKGALPPETGLQNNIASLIDITYNLEVESWSGAARRRLNILNFSQANSHR